MELEGTEKHEELPDEPTRARQPDGGQRGDHERSGQPGCHAPDTTEILDQPGTATLIQHADKKKERPSGDPVGDHDHQPPLESVHGESEYANDHEPHVSHGSVRHQLFCVRLNGRHP